MNNNGDFIGVIIAVLGAIVAIPILVLKELLKLNDQ